MPRDLKLSIDGDSRDAERALKATERGVKSTSRAVDDLGDDMRQAGRAADRLDRDIDKLTRSVVQLGAAFAVTSDKGLLKQLRTDRSALANLQRIRREMDALGGSVKRVGSAAAKSGLQFQALPFNPAVAGALGGGALLGAPFAGAAIGAAGLLGGGLGAAAGGAAITASQNEDVQASFGNFGKKVAARTTAGADAAFAKPLIQAAQTLDKAFDRVADDLDRIFKASSKLIDPLTRGLGGFIEKMLPGFEKAVVVSEKLTRTLGDHLPEIGAAVSDMFGSFADGAEGADQALDDLLSIVANTIEGVGNLAEVMSDFYDTAVKLRNVNPILRELFDDEIVGAAADIGDVGADSLDQIAGASERAAKETARLNDEFDKLFGRLMSSDEAAINYQEAIDGLTESFKDNGKTIDVNTEKGRANLEAVNDVIGAIEQQREAAIAAGEGSTAATNAANSAYLVQLGNLRQQLRALGLNTAAVDVLIVKYEALGRPVTKTLNLRVVVSDPTNALGGRASSGQVRFFAEGGRYKKGEPRVVGENGPEFDIPDSSGFVANAAQVRRMIGSAGSAGSPLGGGTQTVDLRISGDDSWLYKAIMNGLRTGQIQAYAGGNRVSVR